MSETTTQNTQQPQAVTFMIQKIFVKDASFEAPTAPVIFTKTWKPEVHVELNTNSRKLEDKLHEVTLSMTITTKTNNETAFVVEVKQAGVFMIDNVEEGQLKHILGSFCPTTLFPYARQEISNLIIRGGFPELNIAPINFEALYAQSLQQETKQS